MGNKQKDEQQLSPMMGHYKIIKEQYPDAVVLYRLGDFYEMFFEDAIECSEILDITLTGKSCGLQEKAPMCGVPYHAVDNYIKKLVDHGKKVAICEQLNTPQQAGKNNVKRDVVRVITKGTLIEQNQLDANKNNYIASVGVFKNGIGLSWADVSTGEFNTLEFYEESLNKLDDFLCVINPVEIICNDEAFRVCENLDSRKLNKIVKFQRYYEWAYNYSSAKKKLLKQFNVTTLASYECEDKNLSISSAGALVEFLHETQKNSMMHLSSIKYISTDNYLILDKNSRRNLEIVETMRDRKTENSLLSVLDKTKTHMGARYLKKCINQPIRDPEFINERLDAVGELVQKYDIRRGLEEQLSGIRDIERLIGKISYGTIIPNECIGLRDSLQKIPEIKNYISKLDSELFKKYSEYLFDFKELASYLDSIINDKFLDKDECGIIKRGYSAELDTYKMFQKNSKIAITDLENTEREKTGIKTLKIKYNKIFGYIIEVPKQYEHLVPLHYIRRQTISNGERYVTEELKKFENDVLNASEKIEELENKYYSEVISVLRKNISELKLVSEILAGIDVVLSFAIASYKYSYSRPIIGKDIVDINIKNGRHPVIENLIGGNQFVANDCLLNDEVYMQIISGPNMAGKSTYMRQVALISFMAHLGCFVPADYAEIPVMDRIFTRVGASDDVASGISTFMLEMIEVATILNNATNKSLVILDEIGRGTSTYDGLSIAWAVSEYIGKEIKSKTLFATHYHELAALEGRVEGIKNFRILVREVNGNVVFLHKIIEGGTNKSFGIEVASFAGLPKVVVERAKTVARELEKNKIIVPTNINISEPKFSDDSDKENNKKDFTKLFNLLSKINVNNCSPMQALGILENLVNLFNEADKI